jgi:class 3 adenylate cyclase
MTPPETRYARQGETHIAYRVEGEGPCDVVVVPNWLTNIEVWPTVPFVRDWLARMSEFARVVYFDQPGTGLSDPIPGEGMPTLETFADAVRAVMDDAGLDRAALYAWDLGAAAAIVFATTYPGRVSHLVMNEGTARRTSDGDYPGIAPESVDAAVEYLVGMWGSPQWVTAFFPEFASDPDQVERFAGWLRQALSPGMARRVFRMVHEIDVRPLLPLVSAPALLLHRPGNFVVPAGHERYLAEHIPNAELFAYEAWTRAETSNVVDRVRAFLTGRPPAPRQPDVELATVMFTDIVASTERIVRVGDDEWSTLLDRHNQIADRCINDFRGRFVETTGDGVVATFDGPVRGVNCALAIRDAMRPLDLNVRAGLHAGEVRRAGREVRGIAVHIAARVTDLAKAGEVAASSTVRDLVVGSDISWIDRGSHVLKGVPDPWRIYTVAS